MTVDDLTPLFLILLWIGWSLSGIRRDLRALTDTKPTRPMGDM